MPTSKRNRIQAYLDPELAEAVRLRAQEEDRAESREISRLVKLGLEADAQTYSLGGVLFRTKADIQLHVSAVRGSAPLGQRVQDAAVLALVQLHPEWENMAQGTRGWLGTAMVRLAGKTTPSKELAVCFKGVFAPIPFNWTKLISLLRRGVLY